jgi:hypothetical protein
MQALLIAAAEKDHGQQNALSNAGLTRVEQLF